MTSQSLAELASRLRTDDDAFSRYYLANGVRFDPNEEWDAETRVVHYCSMVHSHYDDYRQCYTQNMDNDAMRMCGSLLTLALAILAFLST